MGLIFRQTFKSSIALYIGVMVGVLNRLFFYPLALTEAEIGLVVIITNMAVFMSQVGLLGATASLTKYYSYFKERRKLNTYLSFIITQALIGISLLIILFFYY